MKFNKLRYQYKGNHKHFLSLRTAKIVNEEATALCATQPTPAVTEDLSSRSTHLQDQPLITGKGLIGCKICFVESTRSKILHSHGDITIMALRGCKILVYALCLWFLSREGK